MNKYEFISEVLNKQRFDLNQKERLLKLIIEELKNDGINQIEFEERLKEVEHTLRAQTIEMSEVPTEIKNVSNDNLPTYLDSSQLPQFLKAYNQDAILKYSCHEFDEDGLLRVTNICKTEGFNLFAYQQELESSFKRLAFDFDIPEKIYALINAYLNGGKEWSSDKIKINWKSPELLEWAKQNSKMVPNPGSDLVAQTQNLGLEFGKGFFRSKIFQCRVNSFSELVIYFKNLFHIRADNSLRKLLTGFNGLEGFMQQVNFNTTDLRENIEFFTDVDKLLQAYKRILKIMINIADKYSLGRPEVKLSLKESDDAIILCIHHTNSVYKKTIKNAIERTGEAHGLLIDRQINGLCDLYIVADFDNGEYAKINLWNGKPRTAEKLESFQGVEYQLNFR
jgi:hypothetical protein